MMKVIQVYMFNITYPFDSEMNYLVVSALIWTIFLIIFVVVKCIRSRSNLNKKVHYDVASCDNYKNSINNRIKELIFSEYMCDIYFILNYRNEQDLMTDIENICRIPGHRVILGTASFVFKQMLYETKNNEILITDVDPDAMFAVFK